MYTYAIEYIEVFICALLLERMNVQDRHHGKYLFNRIAFIAKNQNISTKIKLLFSTKFQL